MINGHEFKDLPSSQIEPGLADQAHYLASEPTMQRLLRHLHQNIHRRRKRRAKKRHKPFALNANVVNLDCTWDITHLLTMTKGQHFYPFADRLHQPGVD
ncbi:MAG TPA: hypothetical protein PLB25_11970 [Rhodoferax sp.]|nr:hypothetical protein [Rhodoferax sp.]